MYSSKKTCILLLSLVSLLMVSKRRFFSCNVGLRQGENLSPFLFSVHLTDLESFFFHNDLYGGIECLSFNLDNEVHIYFKLFIPLYADGTVIMSESSNGLQSALTVYNDYCKQWKLTVNINKSKVVIFFQGWASKLFLYAYWSNYGCWKGL